MIKAKAGQIAPYQLFFILFVSRVVVTLTYVQTVSVGKLSTDLAISIIFSYGLTMLLCIPVWLCAEKHKSPFNVKWLSVVYSLYFLYFAAVNVSRFSYFATSRLTPDFSILFFVIIIVVSACYASIMGIEGIARFGAFCGVILLLTALIMIAFNVDNANVINLFPLIDNTKSDIAKNSIVLASNSIEPAIFLAIEDKVNGETKKPLFWGITASYMVIFLLIIACQLTMGAASSLQAYPVFSLFQLASLGSMSRLDIFHTAFWVLALFLKVAVLIFCSTLCIMKYKHSTKCVMSSVIVMFIAIIITEVIGTNMVGVTKLVSVILFMLFCGVIPLLSIAFIKKNRVDDNVDKTNGV